MKRRGNELGDKKLPKVMWILIIVGTCIGGFLGMYLIGNETGEYRYELVLPIVVGSVVAFLIFLVISKINKKRNGNVPDIDERSVKLIQKYFVTALYLILFGCAIALLVAYAMGVQYVEIGLLMICLLGIFIVLGLGTLVVKRL